MVLRANGPRCNARPLKNSRESEAPAELSTLRIGRSLTLPSNELVG